MTGTKPDERSEAVLLQCVEPSFAAKAIRNNCSVKYATGPRMPVIRKNTSPRTQVSKMACDWLAKAGRKAEALDPFCAEASMTLKNEGNAHIKNEKHSEALKV